MAGWKRKPVERWLTPGQAAERLNTTVKTLTRWSNAGKIHSARLPSGHRRYRESDVEAILNAGRSEMQD